MKKNILFLSLFATGLLIFSAQFFKFKSSEIPLSFTQTLADTLSNGEILFLSYCTSCHNPNLRKNSTGPALGNITKFRSQEYLINITKNSQRAIANGNNIFTCLYKNYRMSIMTSFEFLTDKEIIEIYDFIEKESIEQNIGDNEVEYIMNCYKERKEPLLSGTKIEAKNLARN